MKILLRLTRVFSSVIIRHLTTTFTRDDVGVIYVYCDFKDTNQTAINLMGSLLQQIIRKSKSMDKIIDLDERHQQNGTQPLLTEYLELLQSQFRLFSKVFVVIDALDECPEHDRDELLNALQTLPMTIRLLITSRPTIIDLKEIFEDTIPLEILGRDEDITKYLEAEFQSNGILKHLVKGHEDLKNEIIKTIRTRVKGMLVTLPQMFLSDANCPPKVSASLLAYKFASKKA